MNQSRGGNGKSTASSTKCSPLMNPKSIEHNAAIRNAKLAVVAAKRAIEFSSNQVDAIYDLSVCCKNLRGLYEEAGDFTKRLFWLKEAGKAAFDLIKADPKNWPYKLLFARCKKEIGLALYEMQRFPQAKSNLKEAMGLYEEVLASDYHKSDCLLSLSEISLKLGEIELAREEYFGAVFIFEKGVAIANSLRNEGLCNRPVFDLLFNGYYAYGRLAMQFELYGYGELALQAEIYKEPKYYFDKAMDVLLDEERTLGTSPHVPIKNAKVLVAQGDVAVRNGDEEAANSLYEAAMGLLSEEVSKGVAQEERLLALRLAQIGMAKIGLIRDDFSGTYRYFLSAAGTTKKLLAMSPHKFDYNVFLIQSHKDLFMAAHLNGNVRTARRFLKLAFETSKEVEEEFSKRRRLVKEITSVVQDIDELGSLVGYGRTCSRYRHIV